ncbi:hypothetical protein FN846DRAFT_224806 [Sphaerosporella brunnea]|uniref:Uncharacterized protein n=1 Tax=Sphaerosporella brunnea TaxID=1250544 RepID=A0A5J5EMM8_9PEZI|nr:hypothetical protein FN846DRAFT_224806 [Sphaerosporella brunnea]
MDGYCGHAEVLASSVGGFVVSSWGAFPSLNRLMFYCDNHLLIDPLGCGAIYKKGGFPRTWLRSDKVPSTFRLSNQRSNTHIERHDERASTNIYKSTIDTFLRRIITMGDNTEQQAKKRKSKWSTPYSNMSLSNAQKRLGFTFRTFGAQAIQVDHMLAEAKGGIEGPEMDSIQKVKEKVYDVMLDHLEIEGYPTEADPDFKEANVSDLVLHIISPVLANFKRTTGRKVALLREKEILSQDGEPGGYEEYVVVDMISVMEENFVFVIEAKRSSLGEAMKQCLLAMKDTRDNNGGGRVYGFVTTGESWRMLRYDGTSFTQTRKIEVLFEGMDQEKEKWMGEYSVIVDCVNAALSDGGIVKNG